MLASCGEPYVTPSSTRFLFASTDGLFMTEGGSRARGPLLPWPDGSGPSRPRLAGVACGRAGTRERNREDGTKSSVGASVKKPAVAGHRDGVARQRRGITGTGQGRVVAPRVPGDRLGQADTYLRFPSELRCSSRSAPTGAFLPVSVQRRDERPVSRSQPCWCFPPTVAPPSSCKD